MDVVAAAATTPNIYLQDMVSFGRGILRQGVVIRDATMNNSPLPVDTFQILLIDNSVVYKNARDIRVLDRSHLHPGQVVGSASHIAGQLGVVTGVTTVLDLVELDSHGVATGVIKGVSPSRLRRLRSLNLGDFVVSGPWLGRVVEVSVDVDVIFDDGAVCRITNADSNMLQEVGEAGNLRHRRFQMNSYFYPGQSVSGENPPSLFKAARWLNGYWKPYREAGTVIKVETSGVLVYWIASMHCGTDKALVEASAPPAYQHPDDLTYFCAASNCSWGVADRCFFREPAAPTKTDDNSNGDAHDQEEEEEEEDEEQDEDVIDDNHQGPIAHKNEVNIYAKQLRKVFFEGYRRGRRPQVRRNVEVKFPMVVANTSTSVDVLWQDGTLQHGIPSATLVPFGILNEQEFFPGQHVVPFDTTGDQDGVTRRVGIVRSLDCKDQTVCVSWFKAGMSTPDEAMEVDGTDTVSAYDLKMNHYVYYGDIVIRLLQSRSTDDGTCVALQCIKKKRNAVSADLSWVGRVVDLPRGHVQVKWGDGSISTVSPHEIVVIQEEHYMELWTEMGEWVEDDDIDAPEEPAAANTDNDLQNLADDSDVENNDPTATRASLLGSAVRCLLQLTGDMVTRGKGYLTNRQPPSSSEVPAPARETIAATVTRNVVGANCHDFAKDGTKKASDTTCSCDESFSFPRFDVLQITPEDHHYLDNPDQGGSRQKSWAKAVQKEWKILENDLPETIYVRVYEDRMDLLRVVMVGASGTPYHNGLFFFDLQLPPSYPAAPPQVYYHSFGLRLNPNLYESGTVCLSLLNTFGGEGTEVSSSVTSSLLQVVVSIQGLVLNDQPYYNEAGYKTQVSKPEGRRNSLPYSENAYLLTLRTMLHLLRRPPRGFEEFAKDHFRRRGRFVLRTCDAWLQGCVVGDADATEADGEKSCSAGLKLALASVVPSLVAAFAEIGAEEWQEF